LVRERGKKRLMMASTNVSSGVTLVKDIRENPKKNVKNA